jgi:metallo-beta-lactamase class B
VSTWHAEPAKVFDNLYFLGTQSLNSYAVTTSAGIVIIDPLYDYNAQDEIVDGLEKLGLDPADISHVIVSHGHGDHYGGARLLQERYGAQVLLSAADWDLIEASGSSQPKPERDVVVTDGQVLTVGDTEITFTLTPGHTPGTLSTLMPVKDGNETHVAALWGGTAMRASREFYEAYAASARKFAELAEKAGADIIISNHDIFDDAHAKIAALAERRPGDPHPFVLGPEATVSDMGVAEHCAMAGMARLQIADD